MSANTTLLAKKLKTKLAFQRLKKLHPDAKIELNFSNPLELLIATILSAQCTDLKVNQVTSVLFQRYKSAADYLISPISELENIIRPTGFFRQKAKNIVGTIRKIISEHNGQVPRTMEELIKLPGVGRKTANVVLSNSFNIPGLPVDTHVIRISNRIGLTKKIDPVKIEQELCADLSPKSWRLFSHTLIFHGRRVCKARKPLCEHCNIVDICNYFTNKKGHKVI